jgi:hypothetical protein
MAAFDYLLAVAMLTAPPNPSTLKKPVTLPAGVRSAIQTVAVDWEIMDQREAQYMLIRSEEYTADLTELRRRELDLADAPPLSDNYRFPNKEQINVQLDFNRAYWKHMDTRRTMDFAHADELRVILKETERLYQIWDTLKDARCECYYVPFRRRALKKLRDLVGPDAYYRGALPPPVPVWRFQEID